MADELRRSAGPEHDELVALVAATAPEGPAALRSLWERLESEYGHDAASRAWQEGLASSDIGQT
ncbi:MAG: hypothetical protein GC157_15295 [Frankiales bacterium]|nr:hypothetical protein [Frankiales bacterium]